MITTFKEKIGNLCSSLHRWRVCIETLGISIPLTQPMGISMGVQFLKRSKCKPFFHTQHNTWANGAWVHTCTHKESCSTCFILWPRTLKPFQPINDFLSYWPFYVCLLTSHEKMHGIIPIDHLIYPLVLPPFTLHGECFWRSQTMGLITMSNITRGLIQLGQYIQIFALPPASPLGVLSTTRKPLMNRGAWECFIIFRPMMQKLLNFEYFHQQKFKKKS
jgi:hypothetical protein